MQNDLITLTATNKAISVAAEQTAKALVSKLRTGELTAPMLESLKNPAVKAKVEALFGTKLGNTPAAIKAELAKVSQETLAQTLYRKYAGDNAQGSVYTEHNNVGSEEIAGGYEGISADGAGEIESSGEIGSIKGAGDVIDGIKIIDGKVGGKIPVDEFKAIRQTSIKNPDADFFTLGKHTAGPDSYIARAGRNSAYFDLGDEWGKIQDKYQLTDSEMFDYLNKSALADAIAKDKKIRFSHNPLDYSGSFLADEWEYLKGTLNLTDSDMIYEGGFWYVK